MVNDERSFNPYSSGFSIYLEVTKDYKEAIKAASILIHLDFLSISRPSLLTNQDDFIASILIHLDFLSILPKKIKEVYI